MHSAREHTPLHMRTHRHVPSQANETHKHTHTHTYLGRQAKESRGGGILDDIQVKKKMHVSALVIVCGEYASTLTFQKFWQTVLFESFGRTRTKGVCVCVCVCVLALDH